MCNADAPDAPSTAAPVNCKGDVSYIGDDYCDDANNNVDCNFDGGDCCMGGISWDFYCKVSLHNNRITLLLIYFEIM